MRWLALLLLLPLASATHPAPVDVMQVRQLADVHWRDAGGGEHVGVLGSGQEFFTVEDASTLGHEDLAACYGQGYTATPAGPVEGPTPGNSPFAGHGTWTSGVVCGTGAASAGHYPGLAPAAKVLFVAGLLWPKEEGQRMLFADHSPFVVTASTIVHPADQVVPLAEGADTLITWAAKNEGGDGSEARTGDRLGDERVLLVAATTWDGTAVADYSSRGDKANQTSWPDLAAVGCHVVPVPWTQPGAANPYVPTLVDDVPDGCRSLSEEERLAHVTQGYMQVTGTSFAAPSVAAVALLMREVNPGLTVADAKALLTGSARPFLATSDQDGDGNVTKQDFWLQHGFAAGHGLLDGAAAVASAHYLAIHPGAEVAEALACARIGPVGGVAWLNPGDRCALASPAVPVPAVEPAQNASVPFGPLGLAPAPEGPDAGSKDAPVPPWPVLALALALLARRHHR